MHAQVGARLLIHGKKVGAVEVVAEIVEVHGEDGAPPYLVKFPDGRESLMFPGPDCVVEHAK